MIDPISKLLGSWSYTVNAYSIMFRFFISLVFGAIIGCERSNKRHSAGLRTFIIVSIASTAIMLLDVYLESLGDTNLHLLSGASVIAIATISVHSLLFSSRSQIKGLTTSCALWADGIIGLTIGAGFYTASIISFILLLLTISIIPSLEVYLKNRSNHFEIHLELKQNNYLQSFVTTIRKLGLTIDDIEKNPAYSGSGLSVYSIAITINSKELKKYKTHKEIIEALRTLDYIYHIEEIV